MVVVFSLQDPNSVLHVTRATEEEVQKDVLAFMILNTLRMEQKRGAHRFSLTLYVFTDRSILRNSEHKSSKQFRC